jgi:transcription elongation factor Elf1
MSPKYIVPVDSKEEKDEYVKNMYCKNCKVKCSVEIEFLKDIVEEGYHYEVARCICGRCNRRFEVSFFPTFSSINIKIKTADNNMANYSL